jgi:hypothetical protein
VRVQFKPLLVLASPRLLAVFAACAPWIVNGLPVIPPRFDDFLADFARDAFRFGPGGPAGVNRTYRIRLDRG